MCDCEDDGITVPVGLTGDTGAQGGYGGFSSMWLWSTATGSAPGSTFMRFNSATFSAVTTIYIDQTNGNSADLSAFLASFGTEGLIRVFKASDPSKFWLGTLTNAVDSGAYYTLTVTYITSNGSFTAADEIVVSFTSEGDDGVDGTTVLYNGMTTSAISGNSPSYTSADGYNITGGTISANGDKVRLVQNFTKTASSLRPSAINKVKLTVTTGSGPFLTTALYDYAIAENFVSGSIITEISRITSTTALINIWSYNVDGIGIIQMGFGSISRSLAIPWATDVSFSAEYLNDSGSAITHQQLLIEHYKI